LFSFFNSAFAFTPAISFPPRKIPDTEWVKRGGPLAALGTRGG